VHCAIRVVANSRIQGADSVERDRANDVTMAVIAVPARERIERSIVVEEGLSRTHAFDEVNADLFDRLTASTSIRPERRALLAAARAPWVELERAREAERMVTDAIAEVEADRERLHEDAEAVSGDTGGAATPLVKRILEAEDQLRKLRAELPDRTADVDRRRAAFVTALAALGRKPEPVGPAP
jgi:hypothetical protein